MAVVDFANMEQTRRYCETCGGNRICEHGERVDVKNVAEEVFANMIKLNLKAKTVEEVIVVSMGE